MLHCRAFQGCGGVEPWGCAWCGWVALSVPSGAPGSAMERPATALGEPLSDAVDGTPLTLDAGSLWPDWAPLPLPELPLAAFAPAGCFACC